MQSFNISSDNEMRYVYGKLMEVMRDRPKILGYSAPQSKIYLRGFVIRKRGKITFMANPEIIWKFGSKSSNEGCESIEGRYIVKRPLLMKLRYTDEDGQVHVKIFTHGKARIICHEIDHLNGITIKEVGKKWWYNYDK